MTLRGWQGTRSTTRMPYRSSCATLSGLFESRRTRAHAQQTQGFGRKSVVARIGGETQLLVGFHGVHAAVLQLVGAQLVHQADAAAFLRQIEQQAHGRRGDLSQRKFQLGAAIAALGGQYVAGQALRMNAHQRHRSG